MKNIALSLLTLAGLTASAHASTTVTMLVSSDGTHFSSTAIYDISGSGSRNFEVLVTVSTTNPQALGLSSMIFQPTVSNWGAIDALVPFTSAFGSNTSTPSGAVADATGSYGRISPFAAVSNTSAQRLFGHVHLASGGANQPPSGTYVRIAQAQVTSWIGGTGNTSGSSGINIAQLNNIGRTASDPAFNAQVTNVHVFRFAVQIDTSGPRTFEINAPLAGFGNRNTATGNREVCWYADMFEPAGSIREVPTIVPAYVTYTPTPGTLLVFGATPLFAQRRRRAGLLGA